MKRIVLMLICSINCLLLAAQVEVKLSQLCGTSWTRSNNNGYYCCQTYDKIQKYRHSSFTYVGVDGQRQKKEFDGRVYFYLSNAVPRFFDKSKVGMAASGRYIIEESKDGFYCFKILKFSDKELVVVRVISKSDKVIGIPESITYYRKN